MDWDYWFFEVEGGEGDGSLERYQDWLFDTADRTLGDG